MMTSENFLIIGIASFITLFSLAMLFKGAIRHAPDYDTGYNLATAYGFCLLLAVAVAMPMTLISALLLVNR
jgi:hypothetical protein